MLLFISSSAHWIAPHDVAWAPYISQTEIHVHTQIAASVFWDQSPKTKPKSPVLHISFINVKEILLSAHLGTYPLFSGPILISACVIGIAP